MIIIMSAVVKRRGIPLIRPSFKGSKHSKVVAIDGKKVCVLRHNDSVESESDNAVSAVIRPDEDDIPLNEEKATPPHSQMKIEERYKLMKDRDTEPEAEDSDSAGVVDLDVADEQLEGNRLLDVHTLSSNVSSELVCRCCPCDVQLMEEKKKQKKTRQGLGSKFGSIVQTHATSSVPFLLQNSRKLICQFCQSPGCLDSEMHR